jgi:succinate dehydrogenase hydrophobic anchor subunit
MRNTYLQFAQYITGVLIAILLGINMVNMQLDAILLFFGVNTFFGVDIAHDPTVFKLMVARAQTVTFAAIYIALLIFALYHAFTGLRNVILELTTTPRAEKVVTGVIIFVGLVFLALGIYTPLALLS